MILMPKFETNLERYILYTLYKMYYVCMTESSKHIEISGTLMKHDCHDYIRKVWNQSENVYRSCKIFTANIYDLLKIGI